MNKYLEKIANLNVRKDTHMGEVKEAPKSVATGSELTHGSKTLFNHALLKAAQIQTQSGEPAHNWKRDALDVGIIGSLGAAAGHGANVLAEKAPHLFNKSLGKVHTARNLALLGGASIAADYAGIKLNHMIHRNDLVEKSASLFPSHAYKKTLDSQEKKEYQNKYKAAPSANMGKALTASGIAALGMVTGHVAGAALGKPIGKAIGSVQGKRTGAKIYEATRHMVGEREAKGMAVYNYKLHQKLYGENGRAIGGTVGAAVGSIPSMSYSDRYQHEYAKKAIERKRNQNG